MITFPEVCKSARTHTVCVCVEEMYGREIVSFCRRENTTAASSLALLCMRVCVCVSDARMADNPLAIKWPYFERDQIVVY